MGSSGELIAVLERDEIPLWKLRGKRTLPWRTEKYNDNNNTVIDEAQLNVCVRCGNVCDVCGALGGVFEIDA